MTETQSAMFPNGAAVDGPSTWYLTLHYQSDGHLPATWLAVSATVNTGWVCHVLWCGCGSLSHVNRSFQEFIN